MSNWTRSNVSREQLLRLVKVGQLPPLTEAVKWIVPADESMPHPPSGYVVSFVVFHERGDDQLHQPPDEAGPRRRLHPGDADQLEQQLAQGVVLLAE
jgi:hypothetical protein